MENTRKLDISFEAIAWGAFFIFWGITAAFKSLPDGTGAIGIGIILLGLNLARLFKGQPTSTFTTAFGILALFLGGLDLSRSLLNLSFELPIFSFLLITLGLITLMRTIRK